MKGTLNCVVISCYVMQRNCSYVISQPPEAVDEGDDQLRGHVERSLNLEKVFQVAAFDHRCELRLENWDIVLANERRRLGERSGI